MTEKSLIVQSTEAELFHSNDELVTEAYDKITDTFQQYYHKAIFEVGDYLVKTFFDGDFDRARVLKQKLSDKEKMELDDEQLMKTESFHQLTKRFVHGGIGTPSKSWLYNAVKLAVQDNDYKSNDEYIQMNVSKKILLFPYEDRKIKLKYINKISPEEVTVKEAKSILPALKRSSKQGIPYYISNPDKLYTSSFLKKFTKDVIEEIGEKNKKEFIKKTKGKRKKMEKMLTRYRDMIKNLEKLEESLKDA